jgi:activating signal cointegrator complex subunit 3
MTQCCLVAGMLDVQQIFGRAGRPQFEDEGLGIIITQHAQLAHYLGMLTHQTPIESKFTDPLVDNLNAEIVLGKTCNWCSAALQNPSNAELARCIN